MGSKLRAIGFSVLGLVALVVYVGVPRFGVSQAQATPKGDVGTASSGVAQTDPDSGARTASDGAAQAGAPRPEETALPPDPKMEAREAKEHASRKKNKVDEVPDLDLNTRKSDILGHLNAIVGFYRSSMIPIQKAGEPNDVVYFDQSVELAAQAAVFAFQSAQAEATLLAADKDAEPGTQAGTQQRLQTTKANVEQQLTELRARSESLDKQIATAKASQVDALRAQRDDIAAAIELNTSMDAALQKIVTMSDVQGSSGLGADIVRLQRSVPELNSKTKVVAPQLTTLESARSSGVTSQGEVLLNLLGTKSDLNTLLRQNDEAQQQVLAVRGPISARLRSLVAEGQKLAAAAESTAAAVVPAKVTKTTKRQGKAGAGKSPAAGAAPVPAGGGAGVAGSPVDASLAAPAAPPIETLHAITTDFKALSSAAVPLSQEMIVLEQSKANLTAWQAAVQQEYKQILHALLLRLVVIAIALGVIFAAGEVWRRATNKYIHESRRRRQLLVIRRVTIGLLSAIVLLFGFVTQFNSLATFAGFITAGIAVGLQTILLSVAAYFFIIGRYGVKVGDRITIAAVTGDVIDVGLVRFYMMELAGNGVELNPTGRVAMFSNAVLFQAGMPLYKQIPGTQFAWHELIVKLAPAADYAEVSAAVMKEVDAVYQTYRSSIESQHQYVESWMQASIAAPKIESRLQFNAGMLQLWARFPVEIATASESDERLTKALLNLMDSEKYKAAFAAPPAIQASVRG